MQAGLEYYTTMFRALKARHPHVHIKALTAVEIAHIARIEKMSWTTYWSRCGTRGSTRCPAAAPRPSVPAYARRSPTRSSAARTTSACTARRMRSESAPTARCCTVTSRRSEDRVDHLQMLRDLQDETGGFLAFIPLAYHPDDNELGARLGPQGQPPGFDDLAISPSDGCSWTTSAHQVALDHGIAIHVADRAALRRERPRRDGGAREDLSRGRRAHAAGDDARRDLSRSSAARARCPPSAIPSTMCCARSTTEPRPATAAA